MSRKVDEMKTRMVRHGVEGCRSGTEDTLERIASVMRELRTMWRLPPNGYSVSPRNAWTLRSSPPSRSRPSSSEKDRTFNLTTPSKKARDDLIVADVSRSVWLGTAGAFTIFSAATPVALVPMALRWNRR